MRCLHYIQIDYFLVADDVDCAISFSLLASHPPPSALISNTEAVGGYQGCLVQHVHC